MTPRYEPHEIETKWQRVWRSEEHTSELQSQSNLVCRLLLVKKINQKVTVPPKTVMFFRFLTRSEYTGQPSVAFFSEASRVEISGAINPLSIAMCRTGSSPT